MDAQQFDQVAKALGRGNSRRRLLAGLLGVTLAAPLGRAGAQDCKANGKACKKNSQCCSGNCGPGTGSGALPGACAPPACPAHPACSATCPCPTGQDCLDNGSCALRCSPAFSSCGSCSSGFCHADDSPSGTLYCLNFDGGIGGECTGNSSGCDQGYYCYNTGFCHELCY